MSDEPQVKNPQLIHLMHLLRADQNDEPRAAFYAGLKTAKFMLPVGTARTGDPTVVLLTDDSGRDFLPIFTDQASFAQSPDHDHFAVATIDDCANFLYEDHDIHGVVINPYGENMVLTRANLFYVAKPDQPNMARLFVFLNRLKKRLILFHVCKRTCRKWQRFMLHI